MSNEIHNSRGDKGKKIKIWVVRGISALDENEKEAKGDKKNGSPLLNDVRTTGNKEITRASCATQVGEEGRFDVSTKGRGKSGRRLAYQKEETGRASYFGTEIKNEG